MGSLKESSLFTGFSKKCSHTDLVGLWPVGHSVMKASYWTVCPPSGYQTEADGQVI